MQELEENQIGDFGESKPIQSGRSSKVTANVTTKNINQSLPKVQVIKTYSPSDYKSSPNKENFEKDTELQQLKLEKYNLETKYKTENQELQLKVNALEEHLAKSQQETEEIQRKLQRALGKIQSYKIKSPPLWFRILGIFTVENIGRLGVFIFQTSHNSQLCIDSQCSSQ